MNDMINIKCIQTNKCKCIESIQQIPFKLNTHCILMLIHCFLYHGYNKSNDDESMQRLRDCIMDKNEVILKYDENDKNINSETNHLYTRINKLSPQILSNQLIKERHSSITSVISNLSRRSTSKSSLSRLSSLSHNNQKNDSQNDDMNKPHTIEMSQDRVRRLSGQINENELKEMLNEYDDEPLDDGLISHSEDSSLNETERAEIQSFKLKMDQSNVESKERRGSKHNLFKQQQGDDWNVDEVNKTVQDMKAQLLHLALSSQ